MNSELRCAQSCVAAVLALAALVPAGTAAQALPLAPLQCTLQTTPLDGSGRDPHPTVLALPSGWAQGQAEAGPAVPWRKVHFKVAVGSVQGLLSPGFVLRQATLAVHQGMPNPKRTRNPPLARGLSLPLGQADATTTVQGTAFEGLVPQHQWTLVWQAQAIQHSAGAARQLHLRIECPLPVRESAVDLHPLATALLLAARLNPQAAAPRPQTHQPQSTSGA